MLKDDADRPVIVFRNKVNAADTDMQITFPLPAALAVNDSASYGPTDVGFKGALMVNAARTPDSLGSGAMGAMGAMVAAVPKNLKTFVGMLAKSGKLGSETQAAVSIGTGTMFNKNPVTEFSGVATRGFSFTFKLMAKTKQETDVIRSIVDAFRRGVYPEGNIIQLQYPPTWYINFKIGGKDIPYIPKVFECYLTSVNTAYNSSGHFFHEDGSPSEIELSLQFMESRALTLDDIKKLEDNAFKDGDFSYKVGSVSDLEKQAKNVSDALGNIGNALTLKKDKE
jgi:hypothetical protein